MEIGELIEILQGIERVKGSKFQVAMNDSESGRTLIQSVEVVEHYCSPCVSFALIQ